MKKINELFSFLIPKQKRMIKLSPKQRIYIRRKIREKNIDSVKSSK